MAATKLTPEEKRKKNADYMREYMRASPVQRDRLHARQKKWRLLHMDMEREAKRRWRKNNPEAAHAARVKWQRTSRVESDRRHGAIPTKRMGKLVTNCRKTSKHKGWVFDESLSVALRQDPPTECECCHSLLEYSYTGTGYAHPRAPSLDRLDNTKGYAQGNVFVICFRCNALKKDATLAELEAVVAYMRRHLT